MKKILFIDRDGTLIEEPVDFQVDRLDKIRLRPGVIPSLLALQDAGFELVMVSNQDGLGQDNFPHSSFEQCQEFILHLFNSQGVFFKEIFICPHFAQDNCICRKPKTGLVEEFFNGTPINKKTSWMIGDRESDKEFADILGLQFLPISCEDNWEYVSNQILNRQRQAKIHRVTNETDIQLMLTLDSNEPSEIDSPIGFFSHMLEQIARHAGFNLRLKVRGDFEVDEHHLIEDTALALGEALRQALSDKWGINRYGFVLPMDEALATVALDLSGRGFCQFEACFTREFVGGMATEMVPHFFHSFASALGATLHIQVKGSNHHHMIEACFKGLGRTLRQACARNDYAVPSTKGVL